MMTTIFLIASFNALFFTFLILQKKKALHDKILLYWMVYLGIYTGIYALSHNRLFTHFQFLSASFISLLLLHGPFLYLYLSALVDHQFKLRYRNMFHFIPFILFNAYILLAFWLPGTFGFVSLDHAESGREPALLFNFFLALTVLSGPVYFMASIRLFKKLDINIFNNFSTSEDVNLNWLRKLVYSFGALWTILMVIATVHHIFHLFDRLFCTHGIFLSLSVFIILIGYYGLKQKEIFIQFPDRKIGYITGPKEKYSGSTLTEADAELYTEKIKRFMNEEKPYLDADLTLQELADRLQIPGYHLSRIINERFGQNFFDFINKFRVEEVKMRISDPASGYLSLLGIAFESGFNTKSAFNRVFKKFTGSTPGEYKKQI
jgi:AraC-like DNA-binding protein